jgi:hypothetical protein
MLLEIRDQVGGLLQEPFLAESVPQPSCLMTFAGRRFRRTESPAQRVWRDDDGGRVRVLVIEAVEILPPPPWMR